MQKSISASELRAHIKEVINEVGYSQADYIVEKFGQPVAALINIQDFRLLQQVKQAQETVGENQFAPKLQAIREELLAGGYQPRSKTEIDADLQAERDSWND